MEFWWALLSDEAPAALRTAVTPAASRAGDEFRSTLARECEWTREVIRLNTELLKADLRTLSADLRVLEARLTLRLGTMFLAWFAAAAVLILNR